MIKVNWEDIIKANMGRQGPMQEDDYISDRITMSRKSLEFFLALGDESRALYEAKNCHQDIMSWLGWV